MDFCLRRDEIEPLRPTSPSADMNESPDLRLIDCTRFSKKDLNSVGASSGWTRAGTQSSLEGSFSSSSPLGAIIGMADRDMGGISGSMLFPTSIDSLLKACKLLSSWAMSLGLSILVRGNCEPTESAWTSRSDNVGDSGGLDPCSNELLRCDEGGRGRVWIFLRLACSLWGVDELGGCSETDRVRCRRGSLPCW